MPSPPKPWELAGSTASVAASTPPTSTVAAPTTAATVSGAPAVPARPASIASSATSTLVNSAYSSPYSSTMGYNRFASPYGSYGGYGYGGGMYGGMGYGGYGGYGMGMGPMGMMGNPMDPNNPSLSQSLEASTAQTFAVLQSIVQTFGGFAQMLESTFMATHSSFFAMVGVAEQLGNLRNAVGTVLGLFGLVRWIKDTLTGRRNKHGGLGGEFRDFVARPPNGASPNGGPPASRKPLFFFLLAMFGLPYLMHKLIRSLQSRLPPPMNPLDPKNLQFARALYLFSSTEPHELALQKGDVVAVMQTTDPVTGAEMEWWRGRNRAGAEGWFPRNYVEVVKRPGQEVKPENQPLKKVV